MIPPSSDSALPLGGTPIELGPHLPMVVYHAIERWHRERGCIGWWNRQHRRVSDELV